MCIHSDSDCYAEEMVLVNMDNKMVESGLAAVEQQNRMQLISYNRCILPVTTMLVAF